MIAEDTETWTTGRVLIIEYDRDGRYHERLFSRTVSDDASPEYIDLVGGRFNVTLLTRRSKTFPIPDDATLYRWVLKDGTVVTTTHDFPQSDCTILRTFDEHYMCIPMSNIAYVVQDALDGGNN